VSILAAIAVAGVTSMPIVRGHVAPSAPPATVARPAGVCLFQIPGQMEWVNLYALTSMRVSELPRLTMDAAGAETVFVVAGRFHTIKMAAGQHISTVSNAVMKRLAQCQAGEQEGR
jgi:hypothetical protein